MSTRLKLWTGMGLAAAAGAATHADAAPRVDVLTVALPALAQGGEGGEGGEAGGAAPSQYRLMLRADADPQYDATAAIAAYADHAHDAYAASHAAAQKMRGAIRDFLDDPTARSLDAARRAWIEARRPYLITEAFRYYEGPIDGPGTDGRAAGPETRLNAWPLNEAVIDYVEGDADAGFVHATDTPVTREAILSRDQVADEADVTTGWHAIEFLLWGQDTSDTGPGERSHEDYLPGDPVRERRRAYLATLTDMLVDDLAWLTQQWDRDAADSYAAWFLKLPQHEAIGRMLTGAANLAGHELASERLAVALDSGAQEDEQSCFSDTTYQDFVYDLRGIRQVWFGSDDGKPSLADVLRKVDPKLADTVSQRFATAEERVAKLHDPFDRILVAAPDSAIRADAEAAVTALQELAAGLRDAGRALAVLVIVPGV